MHKRAIVPVILLLLTSALLLSSSAWASCAAPGNAIEAENCLTGTPQSTWDISGAGDSSIQGFGDNISVNVGQTINFKVKTNATSFHLDIYRMGYYQGNGARKVATVNGTPHSQPNCLTNAGTGLYDCGNWAVSASWAVPSTAVSGIYFARVIRDDTQGASHIVFIVRNDASHSDILFQATDTSWQAYNDEGGQNLYGCGGWDLSCRAYKVSYNRPFHTRDFQGESVTWVFGNEYPMVRWLEANGYDVSYFTDTDTDRNGALILNHKMWMSNGHDEYWSGNQRANIEAARNAGVHLAFFSGNTMFWKTRWENSTDGSNTPYRTLVCYKETANDVTDPLDPPTWTGTWRDPRSSPPADGGRPENAIKGNIFRMNGGQSTTMQVPAADGKMRFWRNTTVATASGTTNLAPGTVGAEFDDDEDNGFRPAGLFELTATSVTDSGNFLLDYGVTYGSGTAVNKVVMYRHSSGAIVFSTGTYRWAWGLDSNHDDSNQGSTVSTPMKQATVNLFADMGIQPVSLQSGLVLATASTDAIPPASTITSPTSGATIGSGTQVTIQGTAADTGGGVVAAVEVSTDNGATWHPASGRASWTYSWPASGNSTVTLRSRAVDDSGNLENPSAGVTVTVGTGSQTCPCTIFGNATPTKADEGADSPSEVGVLFKSDVAGSITGIRFYKSAANTGTHTGNLWSTTGTRLATATFTGETASGWQTVNFATPVAITAGTYYVASYFNTIGHYAEDDNFFTAAYNNAPLHAAQDGVPGVNGVYIYSSSSAFPNQAWLSANYWVDVVFTPVAPTSGVSSVTLNPTSVTGGSSSVGTVTLTGPAPSSGVAITLSSDNAAATPSPSSLTIPSGQTSGTFTVTTTVVTASTTAHITASDGKTNVQATLTITPVPTLSSVTVNPTSVVGGNGSTGTATLTFPAPAGIGIIVTLASDNAAAAVPTSVTVPASATSATFPITTTVVSSAVTAHISGTYNSVTPTPAALTISASYGISGTISGAGGSGATVNLTGAATASVTADASGNYTFNGLPNGSYTVTPSKSGFTFTPASQNVTVNNADVTGVNFTSAAVPTYTISGTISGAGGSGATVNLTGTSTASGTADASGNYTFSNLINGSYTVTPSNPGFTFIPASQIVTVNNANVTAVNFTSAVVVPSLAIDKSVSTDNNTNSTTVVSPTFTTTAANELLLAFVSADAPNTGTNTTVSSVVNATGGTLTWVLVRRTNTQRGTAEIWRAFAPAVLTNASVRATLSRSTTATITVMTFTGVDTSGTSGSGAIGATGTGNATTGAPTANLTTTRNGSWVMGVGTDSATGTNPRTLGPNQTMVHQFARSGLTGWVQRQNSTTAASGTVVTINDTAPTNHLYDLTIVEVLPVTGAGTTYNISGTISGSGGNAATVTLSGAASASVTADASGNYTFTGLVAGSYTVTPSKSGFAFTPPSQNVTITNANVTGVNFSTAVQTFTLQGTISGLGGNAATVNLTGTSTASVTADASGNYTFTGLVAGSYTVTPSKSGFTFTPASQNVTITNANVTGVNFSTAVQTFTLQGTISGPGGNAATVNLTGTSTASVTADASGNYTFSGLLNGSYTVTPSKTGFTFNPGSQPATVNSANVSGVNFSSFQTCPCSLWTDATVPGTVSANDPFPVELGVRFSSDVAGYITGIRFYKGGANTGTHLGNLWSNSGTLMATATFANETASGWQQVNFANPVPITANTTYVASYHSEVGNYSVDQSYFSSAFNSPPLHGMQDGASGANGAYLYGPSAFPTETASANNYYVDVVFNTTPSLSISGTISGAGGNGATVNLTGAATATVTADAAGKYSFTNLSNGAYTVTPSKSGFTFTPASQNVTLNNANVATVNFSTVTYSIAGTISGTGGNAATVNLTGTSTATVTADASGAYTFTGLVAGSYTVTPSKLGFSFTPASQNVTVTNANVTGVDFTSATVTTFTVSGAITGAGGNGATVNLTGSASATVTADATGAYTFPIVPAGSYTVTPSKAGFIFTPASRNVTVTTANVTAVNFSSAVQTYTLQGTISGPGGNAASVSLTGTSTATATANASGAYTFTGLLNGSYTVTPSKTGFSFSPITQVATVSGANVTGVNFSSFANCPCSLWTSTTVPGTSSSADPFPVELGVRFTSDLAGYITGIRFYKDATNTGTHLGNLWSNTGTLLATATFSGETASGWQQVSFATPVAVAANTTYVASYHTDVGNYSVDQGYFASAFNNPPLHGTQNGASGANGVYIYGPSAFPTDTASSSNYYVDVVFSTGQNISGTISGLGGNGATVTLTGAATATTTADASGFFIFTGLANGAYTVTPSKSGFTFTPANRAVTVNNANVTAVNFSTVTYTISGTISGTGGNAATVNLTGAATATVTANASGAYTFSGLVNGSYTVTPSKAAFIFTPVSQNVTVNSANVTAVNFTSAPAPTFSISGTISGPGGNGATVNLTGTSTATVTANASGAYTFTGLLNGSYTVTPSKSGFTFTPASQNVTVNSANVTAVNFSTVTYTISGTISGPGGNAATVNLTGAATASVTADASGNYTLTGVANGSYTVTPSKSGFAFTPASQNVTVNSANVTAVNFSSAVVYSISGTISGPGGNAATVSLTGASTATVTADASGNYTFGNLNNGAYTVTPSKAGFTYTPASQDVTVNSANVTAVNFSTVTYTISGTISGPGGNAATVNLTGTSTASVTADASGNFTFSNLGNGAYTVTPSKAGFIFTPASQGVTVNSADVTAVNFSSTAVFSISGTISGPGGNAATVNLTGTSTASVTADASGNYTFNNLSNGAYTVTPSKSGFTFTPINQAVTVNNANVTAVNFSTVTYSISGTISGPGGNAATVNLTGSATAAATTDASGNYAFTGLVNGAYTVTPSKAGFTFTPTNQAVTVSGADVTAVNFNSAVVTTFAISGTISGPGGNAATVNLTGAATASVTADASGNYTFSNLVNGAYTVTPSKSGFTFTPTNQAVTVNNANVTAVNFTSAAAGAGLAIDKTVFTDRSTNATTIVSPTFTTAAANELLLAFVATDGPSSGTNTTVSGVTGGSLTWALVRRTNTQRGTSEVWRAFAPAVLTNASVTATLSTSTAASITVVTFTGADTSGTSGSGAIGATGSGNAASGGPTASLTTTRNNSWVIGVGNDWDGATNRTVGASQTMVHQYLATGGDTFWVQRQTNKTATAGTSVTINDTAPTADRYNLTIVEVLPAP